MPTRDHLSVELPLLGGNRQHIYSCFRAGLLHICSYRNWYRRKTISSYIFSKVYLLKMKTQWMQMAFTSCDRNWQEEAQLNHLFIRLSNVCVYTLSLEMKHGTFHLKRVFFLLVRPCEATSHLKSKGSIKYINQISFDITKSTDHINSVTLMVQPYEAFTTVELTFSHRKGCSGIPLCRHQSKWGRWRLVLGPS